MINRTEGAWKPVVCRILEAFSNLKDDQLVNVTPHFYNDFIDLLLQDVNQEICSALHLILKRIGTLHNLSKKLRNPNIFE